MLHLLIYRLGGGIAIAVLALGMHGAASADETAIPDGGWTEHSRSRLYGVLSGVSMDVAEEGPFNMDNFAALPDAGREAELRYELSLSAGGCKANLKPRLRTGTFQRNEQSESETEFFFNAAYMECQLRRNYEISAGRQSLQWGNGQYRSPSNPFFAESVRFNPAQEVLGKDFITASYRPGMAWGLTYIGHLDNSHIDPDTADFERTNGLKFDWTGDWFSGGTIWSKRHGLPSRLGAYSTFTVSDAVLIYGEATASRDSSGLLPSSDGGEITLAPAREVDDRRRATLLAGTSYTFESGLTAYFEYLNSNEAFDDAQAEDWLQFAWNAAENLGGAQAPYATGSLASAIEPGWRQLRNNYLFLQLVQSEYRQKADLALRYVRNLDDDGYEVSAAITVRLADNAEWFIFGSSNHGGPETEFGRLNRNALQIGFRVYAF